MVPNCVNLAYLKHYIVGFLKGNPEAVLEFKFKTLLDSHNILLTHEKQNIEAQQQISRIFTELKFKYEINIVLDHADSFVSQVSNEELTYQELALDSFGFGFDSFEIPNWEIKLLYPYEINNISAIKPTHIFVSSYDVSLIRRLEIYGALSRDLDYPLKSIVFYISPLYENLLFTYTLQAEISGFKNLLTSQISRPNLILEKTSRVIVDKREFASNLPYELHKQGIQVIPATLQVGDYVLSPNICVERKSVSTNDIYQSLDKGRLSSQLLNMKNYYEKCILLIEFREDTNFSLSGPGNRAKVCGDLSKLLCEIPGVSILWSTCPEQSAKLFLKLKSNNPEPDLRLALNKGNNSNDVLKMMLGIPGISNDNFLKITQNFPSVSKLALATVQELEVHLDSSTSALIFEFFNRSQEISLKLN